MNKIEQRRIEEGLTVDELCRRAGICRKSYYNYSADKRAIPSDVLIRLADILRCSTDYLLGRQKFACATVIDSTGEVLAVISQGEVIEHDGYKVVLT